MNTGFWAVAVVYLWSSRATAAGAVDDSAAQAHPASARDQPAAPAAIPAPAAVPAPAAIDARIPQRSIVFQPDRPSATLERHGLAIIDGVWSEGWLTVCTGPCVASMPFGSRYRVSGSGVRRSRELTLDEGAIPLRLEATTGGAWTLPVGVVATAAGGVGLFGGLLAWGMTGLCVADNGDAHACDSGAQQLGAGISMAVGAAMLVTGIALLSSQRTTVDEIPASDGRPLRGGIAAVPVGNVWLTPRGIEF